MTDEFRIDRTVFIRARRSTVFRYFTDSERFAAWWGAGSAIDPKPGGTVHIRYPNGVTAGGEVIEIVQDERLVFTYGYDDSAKPIARGASRVSITLTDERGGTLVRLVHDVDTAAARDSHVPGWRHQLSLFANVVAKEGEAAGAALIDRWFEAWAEADGAARSRIVAEIVTEDVTFRDAYACVSGRDELALHIGAARMHMPGITLVASGAPIFCQGTGLSDFVMTKADGTTLARGTNVVEIVDGKIGSVTGFSRSPR